MKLVMTLLARDEADIVEAHLAFHLNAGVDFVVATDHRSSDGTSEILESYARMGYVHVVREEHPTFRESRFITRMARLAASDFRADWVINSCADEFWWPRGRDLRDALGSIPPRYGAFEALVRNFVPRPGEEASFAERMTVRYVGAPPIHAPDSVYRPLGKVVHRAAVEATVSSGSHSVSGIQTQVLRGWYPIEVLHFPIRSAAQYAHKAAIYQASDLVRRVAYRVGDGSSVAVDLESGRDAYASLVVGDDQLDRGLQEGSLVADTRLRDALRTLDDGDGGFLAPDGAARLRFEPPTLVEDAAFAVELAALGEADVVRLRRRVDELERRVLRIEEGPLERVQALGARLTRRLRDPRT